MQQTEVQEFQRVLSGALSLWRQDVSEFALSVWWEACKGFSLEQVRKALTAHAMDPERGRFPPMPADIVKALHGTHTDRSLLAWGRVHRAMSEVGAYATPEGFDSATVSAIFDMGGWPKLCQSGLDELPFVQRRFCELHRAYSARPEAQHAERLIGLHDQHNAARGFIGHDSRPAIGVGDVVRQLKRAG
jgi:hypothetical protein